MENFKRFIKYYKPHKFLFIIDITCAIIMATIDLVFPIAVRRTINDFIPNGNMRYLTIVVVVLAIFAVIRFACSYFVDSWGHIVGTRMEGDMRKDIFSHLQKLSVEFFDNNKTGNIMSRVVNDLRDITELAHHGPEDLIISVIMLIGSFSILMTIEWRLTLIIFLFIPIMGIFGIMKRKNMSSAFREQRKKIANVNSSLENSLSGIRVTKSFGSENFEIRRFNKENIKFVRTREKAFKIMAQFTSGILLFSNALDILVLGLGGYFAYKGYLNIGDFVAYLFYVNYFLQPLKKISLFIQQYQDGMTGFERFTEIMDLEPKIKDNKNAVDIIDFKGNIKMDNISFRYSDNSKWILKDLTFEVEEGKTLAIVGPSGGGKSTLCQLILRFYDTTDGAIYIDDKNIKHIKMRSLRQNIGFVHQETFLFTGTVKENIQYGSPDSTEEEIVEAAKNANIHDFIMELPYGYETYVGEKGIKLSGGQRQRISIARVFLKNPKLIILDEATSALDNENERLIQKSLEKLSSGRTTIIIAHRLSTIKNADEILVLSEKGIEEKGKHLDLIEKNGLYKRLYEVQKITP